MSRKEEVRDGFFGDLPAYLQSQLMEIHKIIVDNCNSTFKENNYSSINKTPWAKQMLAEFLTAPKDKYYVGGVRVYKYGKRYRCMIQITGHVTNNRNSIDEELFHDFIRNVHQDIRAMIKRKYDLHLTCESVHGEHFEGFDVWTSKKVAEQIWKSFDDKKTKKIDEYNEGFVDTEYTFANILEMPKMLVEDVADYYKLTESTAEGFGCYLELYRNNDTYEGRIYVDDSKHWLAESVVDKYEESHPCIKVYSNNTLTLEAAYAEKLFNELESVNEDVHYSWITQEESENL